MKTLLRCICRVGTAALALAALPALAEEVNGQVTGIYVELAPGLMIEKARLAFEVGNPIYAEVRIETIGAHGGRTILVRMNRDAAEGDRVVLALGERGRGMLAGPIAAPTRIVSVSPGTGIAQIDFAKRNIPPALQR